MSEILKKPGFSPIGIVLCYPLLGVYSLLSTFFWFHFFYDPNLPDMVAFSVPGFFFLPYLLLLASRFRVAGVVGISWMGFFLGFALLGWVNSIEDWPSIFLYWAFFSLPPQIGLLSLVGLLRYWDTRKERNA